MQENEAVPAELVVQLTDKELSLISGGTTSPTWDHGGSTSKSY
jgi:bacteriocin-like protein